MSIVQAAIIGSAAGTAGSGYPVPGSGYYLATAGVSNSNGTPYDPGGAQSSINNSAAGFYRRAVTGEWFTGSYATTDMAFFTGKTIAEELVDTYVSFGLQDDVQSFYSMYWLGYFQAPATGTYNIQIASDDQSMVWIGSNAISGFTGNNSVAVQNGITANSLSLTGGQWYPIRIWYDEHDGGNSCQLFIGQTGSTLYNMNYWYQLGKIAYDSVTNGLNVPTYSLAADSSSVDEGTALTFTATTKGIPNGTTLYWTTGSTGSYNLASNRFSPDVTGSFTVNNNTGTFTITVSTDTTTATGSQSYNVLLVDSLSPYHTVGNTVSITVNDTSVGRPQWTNGDATATGPSANYRYYKFHITKTRTTSTVAQISELIILNGTTRLTGGTATNPSGTYVSGEDPDKALDGYYDTKWCDTSYGANNNTSTLIIDYGTAQTSNGFTFATANDDTNRDPVRWTFEGSNDGSTWTVIQQQFTDASITTSRKVLSNAVFNYPTDGSGMFTASENDYLKVGKSSITAPTNTDSGNAGGLPNPPSPDGSGTYTRINLATYPDIVPGMTFVYDSITFTVAQAEPQSNHAYDNLGLVAFYPQYNGTIPNGTNLTFNPVQPWNLGDTWTIEYWSKAVGASTTSTIYSVMGQYYGAGNYIDIIYYNGRLCLRNQTGGICAEPTPGVWTHVAIVSNAGSVIVYYNGVSQYSGVQNYSLTDTTTPLYIGKRGTGDFQYFDGKITNIRISDTSVYSTDFDPPVLPTHITGHTTLLWTPTDQAVAVDLGDNALPINNTGVTYNADYPQIVVGGTITATVTGDSGLYSINYTNNTGITVSSISVKDVPTLGSVAIVGTAIHYTAPCYQGDFNPTTQKYEGSEIDNFSLYFTGNFGSTIVPVSITINHSG